MAAGTATLKAFGAERVFRKVGSVATADRAQSHEAIAGVGVHDVLIVTQLIRLARPIPTQATLALQLHFLVGSESMGNHESEPDDWWRID